MATRIPEEHGQRKAVADRLGVYLVCPQQFDERLPFMTELLEESPEEVMGWSMCRLKLNCPPEALLSFFVIFVIEPRDQSLGRVGSCQPRIQFQRLAGSFLGCSEVRVRFGATEGS